MVHAVPCAHILQHCVAKLRQYLRAGPRHYLGNHKICDPGWWPVEIQKISIWMTYQQTFFLKLNGLETDWPTKLLDLLLLLLLFFFFLQKQLQLTIKQQAWLNILCQLGPKWEHRCMAAGTWNHLFNTSFPKAEIHANQKKESMSRTQLGNLQACLAAEEIQSSAGNCWSRQWPWSQFNKSIRISWDM